MRKAEAAVKLTEMHADLTRMAKEARGRLVKWLVCIPMIAVTVWSLSSPPLLTPGESLALQCARVMAIVQSMLTLDSLRMGVCFLWWIRSERRDLRRMEGQLAALGGNNAQEET